jgi:hypothetical protein
MKKRNIILLIAGMLLSASAFGEERSKNFRVGINFDTTYLASGIVAGYRLNEYVGLHAIGQYISTSAAENIPVEKFHTSTEMAPFLKLNSYQNFLTYLTIDSYPLQNGIRISAGAGYMAKKFISNKTHQELVNNNKWIVFCGVGYEGTLLDASGLGYEIDVGMKYVDAHVEPEKTKSSLSERKIDPSVNVSLTYAF